MKGKQKELIGQLCSYGLQGGLSPPLRTLLASSFVCLFKEGSTVGLMESVNKCIELMKQRDDGGLTNKQ